MERLTLTARSHRDLVVNGILTRLSRLVAGASCWSDHLLVCEALLFFNQFSRMLGRWHVKDLEGLRGFPYSLRRVVERETMETPVFWWHPGVSGGVLGVSGGIWGHIKIPKKGG